MLNIKVHAEPQGYLFEVLDTADEFMGFFESLHLSDYVVKEATAQSQGETWVKKYQRASEATRRKMCGYSPLEKNLC